MIATINIKNPNMTPNMYATNDAYANSRIEHVSDSKNMIDNLNMSLVFIVFASPFL